MKPFSNYVKLNDLVTLVVIFMLKIAILDFVAVVAFLFHKHILKRSSDDIAFKFGMHDVFTMSLYLCQIMD